jgi:hypothetical protein
MTRGCYDARLLEGGREGQRQRREGGRDRGGVQLSGVDSTRGTMYWPGHELFDDMLGAALLKSLFCLPSRASARAQIFEISRLRNPSFVL